MSIAGLVSRAEAGLRPPESVSYNITAERGGVVIHWAGTAQNIKNHGDCLNAWKGFQNYHMRKGWVDIAYSMGVCDHGYVFAGRGVNVRSGANGTDESNQNYYAVCWIGGTGESPTNAAVEAAQWAVAACRSKGNAGSRVRPHSDFRPTTCSGDDWRAIIDNGLKPLGPTEPENPVWGGGDTYEVQPGDTLSYIAQVVSVSVDDLVAWNDIEDPNVIAVGDVLTVVEPDGPAPDPDPPPTPQPKPEPPQTDVGSKMPLVEKDDRGLDVRQVQTLLVANGHAPRNTIRDNGTVDGIFGGGTEDAVESFQRAKGLSVDGVVGRNTWNALIGSMPLVQRDDRGLDVKRVQGLLVAHQFAPRNTIKPDGSLDGIFGSGTEGAVKRFQRAVRTADDGIVGDNTWGELLNI